MDPTMQDVANLAGVSKKTVSNVVNDYPYIKESTKIRVQEAIEQLGYRMNVSARGLRSGRTGIIGLAVPELSLPYYAELADAVIESASLIGMTVLIEKTGAELSRELETLTGDRRKITDGLIFSPRALSAADLEKNQVKYPLVLLGEQIFNSQYDHVSMHNVEATATATQFLLGRGCRNILLIGAHKEESEGAAALRTQGYLNALQSAGVEVDDRYVVDARKWDRATGAQVVSEFLKTRLPFDGVVALNDALALGAQFSLLDHGIAIPDQVQVIGFDNINDAQFSIPTLTSIDPGNSQIAQTAVKLLKERMDRPQDFPEPRHVVADYAVVERASTR